MREYIIGIDLGTTNSEVSVVQNGKVIVIEANGQKIVPSVVGLSHDGALLVGESAKNQYVLYPENTIISVKRLMGTAEKIVLSNTSYAPQEISAIILKHLKSMAETYLQCPVKKAVITVPAYFSDAQRQATREAGELAGLDVVRIINEPTAAALAYGANNQDKKMILVYDLGGGTFDVSVVLLQSQVVEVLATTGNNHLGGDDFDLKIVAFLEDHLSSEGIDISQSPKAKARIRQAAERAKITLSDHPFVMIEEEYLLEHDGKPYHLSVELSRDDYEEMIISFIDETLESVQQALSNANLMASEINEVLLVGGSTRTPIISEKLTAVFGERPRLEIDPDLCVAMGAGIHAGTMNGEKCDSVLVDVTPYTFGTSCVGMVNGEFSTEMYKPLILKNTPIPVTKSDVFYTVHPDQEIIEVHVYQGENSNALENTEIGKFRVEGLSKMSSYNEDQNEIILNFKLDLDGILHVTAKEKRTGLEKKIVINNAISQFTHQDMQNAKKRIAHLFDENTEDKTSDNASNDQHKHAEAIISNAQNILGKLSGDDKEDIINAIEAVCDAINSDDQKTLTLTTEKLSDMLFYLEASIA
ncbi:MAG: heat-shock protein Hsp70 [Gammaproteobacteria bacterium RIFCSPHIGHO2_12_FULL_40_19]|nr:MAG: heat-shock protein Hsp70 [Gammaproteobacteria bacterium RIFCSPHIGHO2_12_FULL_40_19]